MKFIYSRVTAGPERTAVVFLQHQANVFLMEEEEFDNYRFDGFFRCRGGWTRRTPLRIPFPSQAVWCIVIDVADADVDIVGDIEILSTREVELMTWSEKLLPLHRHFRGVAEDYISRAIWIIDPIDEPEVPEETEASGEANGGTGETGMSGLADASDAAGMPGLPGTTSAVGATDLTRDIVAANEADTTNGTSAAGETGGTTETPVTPEPSETPEPSGTEAEPRA